jgi:hypothetical protein
MISELTKNFSPIEVKDAPKIYPFYQSFAKTHIYPRFYQSILEMSQRVNVPLYFWDVLQGCLVIVHRRYIHRPVLYLLLPPINDKLNHKIELEVMWMFREHGCSTRLSEEDMQIYGMNEKDVNKDQHNCEYIYDVAEEAKLSGSKWRRIRNIISRYQRQQTNGEIDVLYAETLTQEMYFKFEKLYRDWLQEKNLSSKVHSAHKTAYNSPDIPKLILIIVDKNKKIVVWCISERISSRHIIITSNFRNPNLDVTIEPCIVAHYLTCAWWHDRIPGKILCNYGTGLFPKLILHKEKLKPIKKLQLYNLKTECNISKEDWKGACMNTSDGFAL